MRKAVDFPREVLVREIDTADVRLLLPAKQPRDLIERAAPLR
jgi:hypothetical protein